MKKWHDISKDEWKDMKDKKEELHSLLLNGRDPPKGRRSRKRAEKPEDPKQSK